MDIHSSTRRRPISRASLNALMTLSIRAVGCISFEWNEANAIRARRAVPRLDQLLRTEATLRQTNPSARPSQRFHTMVDASISHSWALGGGRKTIERVAHMLCEIRPESRFLHYDSENTTSCVCTFATNAGPLLLKGCR